MSAGPLASSGASGWRRGGVTDRNLAKYLNSVGSADL
jgi:hypothetical protein